VELNPLRAGMAVDPWQYPWSSCAQKTGIKEQSWLDFDPFYLSLGKTIEERSEKYKEWLSETIPESEWTLIREATQRGQLTSGRKFEREISQKLDRRIELRGPGRPKRKK